MTESIDDLANAPPEFLEKMFEKIVVLTMKRQSAEIQDHEDRIQELERKLGGK